MRPKCKAAPEEKKDDEEVGAPGGRFSSDTESSLYSSDEEDEEEAPEDNAGDIAAATGTSPMELAPPLADGFAVAKLAAAAGNLELSKDEEEWLLQGEEPME